MSNRNTDTLFLLVQSLETAEKRNFKLHVNRNANGETLKTVQLFDALDKMKEYDEATLLVKNKALKKQQLSNLKAQLYKQILGSLRQLKDEENIALTLHEQMDHARILYNKGLYLQSLKVLDRLKDTARKYHQFTYLQQVLFFEKKIEALHVTHSLQNRADTLTAESEAAIEKLAQISRLSNLSLQLYSWYIKHGHARNKTDEAAVQKFFDSRLPLQATTLNGFYEKLYLYQCYTWYAFILQDFLLYYRYTQKWVDIFAKEPDMIAIETSHYIKALYNLAGAHFSLRNHDKFIDTLRLFEIFVNTPLVQQNDNNRIQSFVYYNLSCINKYFLEGTFSDGVMIVPAIVEQLKAYEWYLDTQRIRVFYYKIACLYFGSGDNENAIHFLHKIINWRGTLRTDLQCYARLLHLIAHYELGNYNLLEYLVKSVYRFMAKMENLSVVEEAIFQFLRQSFHVRPKQLPQAFSSLLDQIKQHELDRFETRAFAYLDIVSWLESKIRNVPVQTVVQEKYELHKTKK
jgi:hypothetical protein